MPFQKGRSGNPGGRPKKLKALQHLCRAKTVTAVRIALEIAQGEHGAKAGDRMKAIEFLIAYGWGKPIQPLHGKVGGSITVELVSFEGEGANQEADE